MTGCSCCERCVLLGWVVRLLREVCSVGLGGTSREPLVFTSAAPARRAMLQAESVTFAHTCNILEKLRTRNSRSPGVTSN